MSEVYHSSTLGAIPLSFTGRKLMQNMRDEVQELLKKAYENGRRDVLEHRARRETHIVSSLDWEPLSRARGRLAQYMSKREGHLRSGANSVPYDDNPHPYPLTAAAQRVLTTPGARTIVLPEIPDGYVLELAGDCVTIHPDRSTE